jgi:chromosome segregation ATPase
MSDTSHPINANQTVTPAPQTSNTSSGASWGAMGILALALAVVFGGSLYQSSKLNNELTSVKRDLTQSQHQMTDLQGQMGTSAADAKRDVNETVARLNDQLEAARKEARNNAYRTQASVKQQNTKLVTDLTAKNTELSDQIDQLKKDNTAKSTEVDQTLTGIKGDVGDVKTEVASAKADIDNTKTDLRRAVGDMGVMSGLIATNATELGELRKLGERNYIEFTLSKNGAPQKVGDIQMALKRTDAKRNRFTLDVMADDKRVEKRDKTVNEPVQFYLASGRLPYEVVVNSVTKDGVKGYLAVPKVKLLAQR